LTQITTPYYAIGDADAIGHAAAAVGAGGEAGRAESVRAAGAGPLRGVFCASAAEAVAEAGADADFIVLRDVLAADELAALCDLVLVPVFARGIGLEEAWTLGASGLNEIRKE
jgi:hypothetical protein